MGVIKSLRALLRLFQNGDHYDSINPYLRPEVMQALTVLAAATDFKGPVTDCNDEGRS
jgi:hypothetical protein